MAEKIKSQKSIDEKKIETTENLTKQDINNMQEKINKEISDKKKIEKKVKHNSTYLFISFFIKRLKEDKIYLFSFIITIAFFAIFSVKKLQETEGYYDRRQNDSSETIPAGKNEDNSLNKPNNEILNDELDVSDYIGVYSRHIDLVTPISISETCKVKDYKIVYQIKRDKTISKYLINDCLGTVKVWADTLKYVSSSGARYISANNVNFLFSTKNMKEVDGETFKIDDEINNIRENKKQKNVEYYFFDNSIILLTNNDLLLLKGANIAYQLSNNFKIVNLVDKIVYKAGAKNQFNFIIFQEDSSKICYKDEEITKEDFKDGINYKIFTINYDTESGIFTPEKELVSRLKSSGCNLYEEDLKMLKS